MVGKDATVITGRIGQSSQDRSAAVSVGGVFIFTQVVFLHPTCRLVRAVFVHRMVGCRPGMKGISHRD